MPKKAVVFDVETPSDDRPAHDNGDALAGAPLFAGLTGDAEEQLDAVAVERIGPIPEGRLGKLEPGASEDDILREYGGGKYKLIGLNATGRYVKGASRVVTLAGEPLWKSETAAAQHRRAMGVPPAPPAPTMAPGHPFGFEQMLALITGQDTRKEQDYERRMAEQDRRHAQEMERLRMEAEIRAKERQAEDERRAKDALEREAREAARALEARKSEREFQALMIQIANNQQKPDATAALLQGIQIAQSLGGAEPADPLSLLAGNIPAILDKAGSLIPGGKPPAAPPSNPDDLHLVGPLGKKGSAVVEHLQRIGKDPRLVIDQAFDALLSARAAPEFQPAPPPPAVSVTPSTPSTPSNGARGPGGRTIVRPDKLTPPPKPATP